MSDGILDSIEEFPLNTLSKSMFLSPIGDSELIKHIASLKNSSAPGNDGVSARLIKQLHCFLLKPLKHFINLIFETGIVPKQLKISIVTPILKSGNSSQISKYRPISVISNFAKLFEKCLKERLKNFLKDNGLLSPNQFGFTEGLNSGDAMYHLIEEIRQNLDTDKKCLAVFLDLAKAFDTVPHRKLLHVLEHDGVRGTVLGVFESYLTDRQQQIWLAFFTLVCLILNTATARTRRASSGAFSYSDFSRFDNSFQGYKEPSSQLYSLGIDSFAPYGNSLSASKLNIASVALSNSVEKPVQEPSDPPSPQLTGTAVIPLVPPPAVPVNAAAANVPSNNGAVFLGSGALGVINLGNGAFALGSGGIGYSDNRQQPRPNGRSPLFPPLPASPNLVPAATPSQQQVPSVPQIDLTGITQEYRYDQSLFVPNNAPQQQYDQNGYERLDASSAGFGQPIIRFRPLKTRTNYATPTVSQVTVEQAYANQLPQSGFGDPIPTLLPQTVKYV